MSNGLKDFDYQTVGEMLNNISFIPEILILLRGLLALLAMTDILLLVIVTILVW